ncbi:hypothetical protein PORCRE_1857 [Porphyromonas crevioricanis JCM 15906]|uniref:Uncharacterized protein n=1 Tax=Porphyromonas crevioricanis JCM 15906 TaxID=1305617 RepID=T1DTC6_9PORP|nr:hypothetical protein PORCRE_1857 [Porphyromonas crevioricanis JCM 15906]
MLPYPAFKTLCDYNIPQNLPKPSMLPLRESSAQLLLNLKTKKKGCAENIRHTLLL